MKKIAAALLLAAWVAAAQNPVPEIAFDSVPNLLKMPEHIYMGEAAGVATTSKGNILVYTRTGGAEATVGGSRIFTHGGARLFEFTAAGKFVREIGQGVYGFLFAQSGEGGSAGQHLGGGPRLQHGPQIHPGGADRAHPEP